MKWTDGKKAETERRERKESVHRQLEEINRKKAEMPLVYGDNGYSKQLLSKQAQELRESIGEPNLQDRLEHIFGATLGNTGGSISNLAGLASRFAGNAKDIFNDTEASLRTKIITLAIK